MKFNPFQPNKIVNNAMFVGRWEECDAIDRYLFQAKESNPQHFLVEGERGIGKSSLLFTAAKVADGSIPFMGSDEGVRFLVISTDLGGMTSQIDIVRAIAREFKNSVAASQPIKEKATAVWDFLSKWEVAGVRFHRDNPPDADDARDALVNSVADLIQSGAPVDGVVFMLDEADAPPVEAGLGEFLKSFTERLTKRGCDNVLVCLAGLPSTISKLRASHESSPRVFSVLSLKPLESDECKEVIRRGLASANAKNKAETKIDDDALELLVEMSEGYPHFVQQFAYCAFDADTDYIISADDILKGAYQENGAIYQLGSKYFDEMYYSKINSDDYRLVLNAMAAHGDAWVQRRDIIKESSVKEATVNNALSALKGRNVILQDDGRQGFYRLPTKSFAAWINAVNSVEERLGGHSLSLAED